MMVFVDALMFTLPNTKWRWRTGCHLLADTEDELHAMAVAIGLKREWFQSHSHLPHYDLTASKRRLALEHGAKEASRIEVVRRMRARREECAKGGSDQ